MIDESRIEAEILRLAEASGPGRSFTPGEVAQALDPAWRPLLGAVRRCAGRLAVAGRIEVLRKGKPVADGVVHGVVRLRLVRGATGC